MLNSFTSLQTLTNGLILQQLNQDVIASNLAKTYQDSNGYLMNSIEEVEPTEGPSYIVQTTNGPIAVGSGPLSAEITRVRSLFLDQQIQQESFLVGKQEMLNSTLSQINSIINASATTSATSPLNQAINNFASAWATLGASANPTTDTADRQAVVQAGEAFATLANTQYAELQSLQTGMNSQVQTTVTTINQILQTLSSINQQLTNSQGADVDSLLDARDYNLDLLSRQINFQSSFNSNGTVNIYLGTVSLLNGEGAATLQANVEEPQNPNLENITVTLSNGTPYGSLSLGGSVAAIAPMTATINPNATLASQLGNFNVAPTGGSFTVNGLTITYTTGNTIQQIINQINANVPGVSASFNEQTQEFSFASTNNKPVTIQEVGGDNFLSWANIAQGATSTALEYHLIDYDISSLITGGDLSGELQARNVTLQNYITNLNQVTTSVINVTNMLYGAGYAADGTTTGSSFFNGNSAQNISVNASLASDSTAQLLAASSVSSSDPAGLNGQIAQFLGNLPDYLSNNFVESAAAINFPPGSNYVDPSQPLNSVTTTTWNGAGNNNINFANTVNSGTYTIDGVTISFTMGDSIDTILANMNASDPNVAAVFNYTQQKFYILSKNPVDISNGTSDITTFGNLNNVLTSSIPMNNGFASPTTLGLSPANPVIDDVPTNDSYDQPLNTAYNTMVYRVTPSISGQFSINGTRYSWTNTESLSQIIQAINNNSPTTGISATFDFNDQTLTLESSSPTPIQVIDNTGNFSVFTGLNANVSISELAQGLSTQSTNDSTNQQSSLTDAQAALTQLQTEQANQSAISTTSGQAGIPIANEEQDAMQSLITYNAMLQVMWVIDEMYSDLVNAVGGGSATSIFQPRPV